MRKGRKRKRGVKEREEEERRGEERREAERRGEERRREERRGEEERREERVDGGWRVQLRVGRRSVCQSFVWASRSTRLIVPAGIGIRI